MLQRLQRKLILIIVCLAMALVIGFHNYCLAQHRKSVAVKAPVASTKVCIERGKNELERKRYAEAVRWFSTALRRDPSHADVYKLRGTAYDKLGQPQKAVQDFTRYIQLKPRDPAGYIGRGDAKNFNQEHLAALQDYDIAVKLTPSSPAAYLGRGLAYAALQKYGDAIKEYQWALKLDPNNTEALGNMGIACMLAGRNIEAMSYFERALAHELDPQWRARIEKWTSQLLQQADAVRNDKRGPTRGTTGPESKRLW